MNKTRSECRSDRAASQDAHADSRKPLVVGLAGGSAAGKSAVAAILRDLGAIVLDADRIAHEVLRSPEVVSEIRNAWTEDVFDAAGRPNRGRIARLVFDRPEKLKQLNDWIHPRVRRIVRHELDEALRAADAPLIVIDAPLLIEGKLDAWCDRILFVEAAPDVRAARARRERDWDDEELARREARQEPLERKRRAADAVVENNGRLDDLRAQVERQITELLHSHD